MDVVVAGGGPAGWALADACARRGLRTALVAPRPTTPWRATYGLWADQVPDNAQVVSATAVRACGRLLDRGYAVLDNAATLAAYATSGVQVYDDRVVSRQGPDITLASGATLRAEVFVDATGHRARGGPEQSAVGLVLPADAAAPLAAPGEAVFMDGWDTTDGLATFLYAVPLPDGRTLLEETSLAADPAVPARVLRARLDGRLARAGITAPADAPVERVRFPLITPRSANAFGAAAGMVHPATGYSVGDAFTAAPEIAAAIDRFDVWPPAARAVHALRLHGLRALLALPADALPEFFAAFFALPAARQRAFLSGRADLPGTAAAMAALFAAAPWRIRRTLAFPR